ncbi:hypothetical protein GC105_04920 [Alkalibaculum sp. M08DMB]|uniref:Pilus assembly protein PilO n=1 Tax=Alkalibaculum sporogenes TaxID=2655001 RepID=A0A6A7K6R5_9FIRM|nr:hypothetical protein [Alkalibaculum sporogenes]MPW25130.1 hypothetical protein [Alkalibaculum sporogenes]
MKLSRREKLLLYALAIIVVLGLYIFYLFIPKYEEYIANSQELKENKNILIELKHLKDAGELVNQEQEVNYKKGQLDQKIPLDMKLPLVYLELLSIRDEANTKYTSMEFMLPERVSDQYEDGTYLEKVSVNIALEGNYQQIKNYLELLYSNQRKLVVDEISYRYANEKIEVNLVANVFALVKEGKEPFREYNFVDSNDTFD